MSNWTDSPSARRLCKLLQKRRESTGLNQVDVAAPLKVSQSYVSDYEACQKRLDFFQLKRISVALGTTRHSVLRQFEEDALTDELLAESGQSAGESSDERGEGWESIRALDSEAMKDAERLGQLLKTLRTSARLRQQDIADRVGRKQPWVHKYEAGEARLDVVHLGQVAYVLGTTLHELDEMLEGPPEGGVPA